MEPRGARNERRPSGIREVIERALARVGLDRRLEDYRIFEGWEEVVGATIARNAQPTRLDSKRLVVVVRSSAWLQELSMLRRDLCRRLNEWMGREVISEIFLIVGKLDPPADESDRVATAGRRNTAVSSQPLRDEDPEPEAPSDLGELNMNEGIAAAFERLWQARKRRS